MLLIRGILAATLALASVAAAAPQSRNALSPRASTPPDNCGVGGECDCSRIKDKNGDEYFDCVTNPNCEHCWHPIPPGLRYATTGADAEPQGAAASVRRGSRPPPCPDSCDCSKIEDKDSEEYFQCITNPMCERCRPGR